MKSPLPVYYKLLEVEALRHRAVTRKKEIHETQWLPVYNEGAKLKEWWGIIHTHTNEKIMFTVNKGISWGYVSKHTYKDVLCTPLSDLPLLINEPLNKEAQQTLKDRLAGIINGAPLNQDLCDRYFRADKRLSSVCAIIGGCNSLIAQYVSTKAYELYRPRHEFQDPSILMDITINGRTYLCQPFNRGKEIVKYPEDDVQHIPESQVLQDEKSKPSIHGIKAWGYEGKIRVPVSRMKPYLDTYARASIDLLTKQPKSTKKKSNSLDVCAA